MLSGRIAAQAARSAAPRVPIASRTVFRSYAAAAAGQNVKPPVALYGVDGTYATALVRCPFAEVFQWSIWGLPESRP